jgi:ferredoxin
VKIVLDAEACTGHGRCYTLEPELFDADDRGHCVVRVVDVPERSWASARSAAANCPEHALQLED